MIGRVAGVLEYRAQDHVLIDVRGVGYVVYVSDRVMAGLPPVGQAVALYTDLLVREDLLQLFGFATLAEKEWHRLLMSVQGVGAKASMAILGALGADGLSRALALGDAASISRAKGVGPKTAARVVMELKDKAPGLIAMAGRLAVSDAVVEEAETAAPAPPARARKDSAAQAAARAGAQAQADALSGLVNLGYGPGDAAAALAEAAGEGAADVSALIRAALKRLAPR
jgi:Holliday junction DNA helicase RuvA